MRLVGNEEAAICEICELAHDVVLEYLQQKMMHFGHL
jgi:hypothetical protein